MGSCVEIFNMATPLLLFFFTLVKCDFGPYKSLDLTHTQDEKALGWAGFKPPFWTRKVATKGLTVDLGYPDQWVEAYEFTQNEHVGTHMDAPLHFVENGRPIDQIPMEQLAGNGVVFDLTAHEYENYRWNKNDVMRWEAKYGQIPDQALILLYTGRSKYYSSNATRYYGFKTPEDAEKRNPLGIIQPGLMSFNVNLKSNTMSVINLLFFLMQDWILKLLSGS